MYIAITSKGYPSRYIYGSPDGSTRGVLAGACRVRIGVVRRRRRSLSTPPPPPSEPPCRPPLPPPPTPAELKKQFLERMGEISLACPPNGLNNKAGSLLAALANECVEDGTEAGGGGEVQGPLCGMARASSCQALAAAVS